MNKLSMMFLLIFIMCMVASYDKQSAEAFYVAIGSGLGAVLFTKGGK